MNSLDILNNEIVQLQHELHLFIKEHSTLENGSSFKSFTLEKTEDILKYNQLTNIINEKRHELEKEQNFFEKSDIRKKKIDNIKKSLKT